MIKGCCISVKGMRQCKGKVTTTVKEYYNDGNILTRNYCWRHSQGALDISHYNINGGYEGLIKVEKI